MVAHEGSCQATLRSDDPIASVVGSGDRYTMSVDTTGAIGSLSNSPPSEFDKDFCLRCQITSSGNWVNSNPFGIKIVPYDVSNYIFVDDNVL